MTSSTPNTNDLNDLRHIADHLHNMMLGASESLEHLCELTSRQQIILRQLEQEIYELRQKIDDDMSD